MALQYMYQFVSIYLCSDIECTAWNRLEFRIVALQSHVMCIPTCALTMNVLVPLRF